MPTLSDVFILNENSKDCRVQSQVEKSNWQLHKITKFSCISEGNATWWPIFLKFCIDATTDFVRWSPHLKNEITVMMAQMPCIIPYCQGTDWCLLLFKRSDVNIALLMTWPAQLPLSFMVALIVKESILSNFAFSAMNSDPAHRLNFIILIY